MARQPWGEPARRRELRWGDYRLRYGLAVALLLVGGILIQLGSAYTLSFLVAGVVAHAAGWVVLPGLGDRRLVVAIPSLLGVSAPLIGPLGATLVVLCLAGWLWVRERPAISYLACLLPIAVGVAMALAYQQYGYGGIVAGGCLVVLVGAAWLARALAVTASRHRGGRPGDERADGGPANGRRTPSRADGDIR